ncbi:hypothetical protein C900_03714 [Fulvivirga imtechensis AK7]|uniref:Uncharacterized protein n=1 Tax=Fulvivirga imtechensis AK7 TaxID=1237149 RepID=L8JNN9_9BACT|nr:hypothetical protein C900_03714 [Fulvivirga imtechensis AK7]
MSASPKKLSYLRTFHFWYFASLADIPALRSGVFLGPVGF